MSNNAEAFVLSALVHPEIGKVVLPYLKDWMFESDVHRYILETFRKVDFSNSFDIRSFIIDLSVNKGLSREQCSEAYGILNFGLDQKLGQRSISDLKKNIQEFIQEKMLAKDLNRLARGDSRKDVIKDMKTTFDFSLQDDDFTNFSSFESLKKAKSSDYPEDGKVIKSKFNFVNKSLLYGGYKYGDLIMIQGGTGVGKSYAGVNEGANCIDQGYKTAHVFLGDMSEYDAWIRYVSYWKNIKASEVVSMADQESLMDESTKQKFSNLRVKSYPAEKLTVDDLVAKLDSLHKEFPFDMLIVDYDSNLKETDDNSYKELGTTYGTLKGFSKERCVTIIMSQIKIAFWGEEKIPKEAAADSSKKQHAVDAQIGFGRNKKNPILGTAFLSKVRRGITDTQSRVYYDLDFSKITEIKADKYEEMLNIFEKRTEDIVNGIEIDD